MNVSVIICTRNRAQQLEPTLQALARVQVPPGMTGEVLLMDNASSDATAQIAHGFAHPRLAVRYVRVAEPGKCRSLNLALAMASGDALLFTDDDVRPPADWIVGMCAPLAAGAADAVAGGVRLAPHLNRPWMTALHESWLAGTRWLDAGDPQNMVGANMAFSRRILERVPQFDPELGPAALGAAEDALISWQLKAAGYRLGAAFEVEVEHHFDPRRLGRGAFLDAARKRGRSQAYLTHHWYHSRVERVGLVLRKRMLRLAYWRLTRRQEWPHEEGMAEWEMMLVENIHFYHQYRQEQQRRPNYEPQGWRRLDVVHPDVVHPDVVHADHARVGEARA